MAKISISVIARNAQETLEACIKSTAPLTDDIVIVIDPRTQDKTESIANHLGGRTFQRNFDNFSNQKNFADSHVLYDWILSLDADEEISKELANEITATLVNPKFDAYSIPRLNIIFGKPIYHTNWGPKDDTHIRLFNKAKSKWVGEVHEQIHTTDQVGLLNNKIIHKNYETVEQFISKANFYSSLETTFTNPLYDFLRRFIWHTGFLDGWHGLFLSYLQSIYHVVLWVKLWEKKKLS